LKQKEKETKKEHIKKLSVDFKEETIKIFNQDFREYAKNNIQDNSIDLILTDPPYPKEYLDLWCDLFSIAKKILKPHAFLVAYTGQMYLDEIFRMALESGLNYYWIMNIEFIKKPLVHGRNVLNAWKPILVFQNGLKKKDGAFSDKIAVSYTEDREMHNENWGQTLEPFEILLDRFSKPNDLIFEPFAGTGTTLVACKNKSRQCIGCETEEDYIDLIKGRLV